MELFKNTNFDFLGKKWPFIIASLVLTAAGLTSLAMKGGPNVRDRLQGRRGDELQFQSGAAGAIRSGRRWRRRSRAKFRSSRSPGSQEVLVGTEIQDETELNQSRQID